jgi:hypothetical protein
VSFGHPWRTADLGSRILSNKRSRCLHEWSENTQNPSSLANQKKQSGCQTRDLLLLAGETISCSSHKQKIVARSSIEPEHMGPGHNTAQTICMKRLYSLLTRRGEVAIPIYGDNLFSLTVVKDPLGRPKANVQFRFVQNKHENGEIVYERSPTKQIMADGMTKPLPRTS